MGGELVTGSPPWAAGGGGAGRQPPVRYGEKFEELCGQYMSLGMSYHDYWDGDCEMVKYYRQAEEYRQEQRNRQAWLQGLYIYRVLLDVSPMLNPMSRKRTPRPYLKEPVPITAVAEHRAREDANRKKMADGKNAMQILMRGINAKLRKGGAKNGGRDGGPGIFNRSEVHGRK